METTTNPRAAIPAQHTPGPWRVSRLGQNEPRIHTHEGFGICSVDNQDDAPTAPGTTSESDAAMANARLIAAAPDMLRDLSDSEIELRLCKELLTDYARGAITNHAATFRRIGVCETVIGNARATIAKTSSS